MDLLAGLNAPQREAVTAIAGPVLVLAGPGSGKTRVLTHRIAYLVREMGMQPYNIMAVTFTNKAAREMRERTEKLLGGALRGLAIGTFHSICARILRIEAPEAHLSNNFVIYDDGDQKGIITGILKEFNLDDKIYRPNALLAKISQAKSELVTPDEFRARTYYEEVTGRVYRRYQEQLNTNNALDFDDLLMRTAQLMAENTVVLEKYQDRYIYLMVDEFQDTNTAQYALLKLLAKKRQNIFVVGDEDQSIYRFRGADFRNVERFRNDYAQAKVILLEQNYRSTQTILDAANAVISFNVRRVPKRLHTDKGRGQKVTVHEAYNEQEESDWIVNEITRLVRNGEVKYSDCAVMYRTNAQSRVIEDAFIRRNLPYKLVGATRFYERREIKDILAYLRAIDNPADNVSLLRVINVPARGIGAKTIAQLEEWARNLKMSIYDALHTMIEGSGEGWTAPFTGKARKALEEFAVLIEEMVGIKSLVSVATLLDRMLERTNYSAYLRDGSDEGEDRWENVQELRNVAAGKDTGEVFEGIEGLTVFLEEVALVSDTDSLENDKDAATLLTLHTAKGLEFGAVFMIGLEEGLLPHSRSFEDAEEMEEERRLAYVGITRAKKYLYLIHTFRRSSYGRSEESTPSRFLADIPRDLVNGRIGAASRNAAINRAATWSSGLASRTEGRVSAPSRSADASPPPSFGSQSSSGSTTVRGTGPRVVQYGPGTRVRHSVFGEGIVLKSVLTSDDEEVEVNFAGKGVKRLLASFARLEKIVK